MLSCHLSLKVAQKFLTSMRNISKSPQRNVETMYRVKLRKSVAVQTHSSSFSNIEVASQTSSEGISYSRKQRLQQSPFTTYDDLKESIFSSKDFLFQWLKDRQLIAAEQLCPQCDSVMTWTETTDRKDGYKWLCRKTTNGKRHRVEVSIRKGSWFEKSNFTVEEIIKFTYWWTVDLTQSQIVQQLGFASNSGVDWDMFCREVCEVVMLQESLPIGGPGKVVQIDESKIGKRKYHKGHRVEGQWVFGGIENESRKSFIFAVEKRDEATLLPLIKKWILPGTKIVSDCWKAYINLEKHGYVHATVNHSKEFVNDDGDHTNRIEGHWRQMKVALPTHGRRKHHYSSYLAEFVWRYTHRGENLFNTFLQDIAKIYKV
ncbi:uncharacterized protein LOC114527774 [Dendronephthya gigantea]|uniref:uncharacterized protein LOC114518621 n=1 Tax=Dendronephthya gigantea TaxID=151771 RepID=UPI00106B353A|nr:uncharacterized protein LOC114518621 [Dendronephthya gigantea]XP_028405264.1 uncharacterized protein LOC114527774 [Dendronephthya gigantea]